MTLPGLTFQVAFGVDPGTVPTAGQWTDLSARMRVEPGVSWSYGRQTELDRMQAGIGSVRLDNSDRALDPTNEAGAYWPNVRPMVRCRLTADAYSDIYSDIYGYDTQVFEGFVEGWAPSWPGQTDSVVDVPIVDGFKLLSMARTSAAYAEEASGTRVTNLLDAGGWPAGRRAVDVGQSDVQAYAASDRIVLNAIQDAANTEDGVFYITPSGDATFLSRYSRVNTASVVTFGDGVGELPYAALQTTFDDDRLWNDISATPDGLTIQRAVDAASQSAYGPRWLDLQTLHTTENEAADFASWLLGRYSEPRLRVDAIQILGHSSADVLEQCLSRRPGDRVTVMRRPPGGGDPIQLDVFIESVDHRVGADEWVTTWSLSPASDDVVWLLGVAGFTELGSTTKLGY